MADFRTERDSMGPMQVPVDAYYGASTARAVEGTGSTRGEAAERLVVARLRAVLDPDVAVLHHVRWLEREHGHDREGEADVVIGDPDRGILVIEVKAGEIRRDASGTWWTADRLPRSPTCPTLPGPSCHRASPRECRPVFVPPGSRTQMFPRTRP